MVVESSPIITEEELKRKHEAGFHPTAFFNALYQKPTGDDHCSDYMKFIVCFMHRVFSIELPEGNSVLDLGSGPTIHAIISASSRYRNIVSADLLEKNRQEVKKWIENDPTAFDWTYVLQTVASLEKEPDYKKVEARLRSCMKEVIPCDVTLPNAIAPLQRTFDVIVTIGCFEAVAADADSYKRIVANTVNLLAPNGHLVVAGVFNLSTYMIGTEKFVSFGLEKKLVDEAMTEAGLEVLIFLTHPRHKDSKYEATFTDMFILLAKKRT